MGKSGFAGGPSKRGVSGTTINRKCKQGNNSSTSNSFKVHTCKYCPHLFLNSRALGGHQNAHKKDKRTGVMSKPTYPLQMEIKGHVLNLNEPPTTAEEEEEEDALLDEAAAAADHRHMHLQDGDSGGSSAESAVMGLVISHQQSDPSSNCVHKLDLDLHL